MSHDRNDIQSVMALCAIGGTNAPPPSVRHCRTRHIPENPGRAQNHLSGQRVANPVAMGSPAAPHTPIPGTPGTAITRDSGYKQPTTLHPAPSGFGQDAQNPAPAPLGPPLPPSSTGPVRQTVTGPCSPNLTGGIGAQGGFRYPERRAPPPRMRAVVRCATNARRQGSSQIGPGGTAV